jgi:hypothetical protein
MPVFSKGKFSVNLGVFSFGGEVDETDRQCAWELYCEIVSRVAVVGKANQQGELVFTGEVLAESLDSLHQFFTAARELMRRYPVGLLKVGSNQDHLGFFIAKMLEVVIRPFLEKWQASYRHWWQQHDDPTRAPFDNQADYPRLAELQADWVRLRRFCREAAQDLAQTFALPDILALTPAGLRQDWIDETDAVCAVEPAE